MVTTWLELFGQPDFSTADEDFRLACHDRAALALCWQAAEDWDVAGLDAARRHIDLVLAARPVWLADALYHSGLVWYYRAGVTGEESNEVAAITELRALIAELPADERRLRHRCLDVLGRTLLRMQRHDLNSVNLSEVIDLLMEALAGFPSDAPYRGLVVTSAASALRDRFKVTGRITDLDLAIELLGDQGAPQLFHIPNVRGVSLLGILLRERYMRAGDPADLDRALACHERAVATVTRKHRMYPLTLTNQGNALLSAFNRDGDLDRLDEAIQAQTEAVRVTPPDDEFYPSRLNNLANSLSTAFDVTGDATYLDQAVDLYRESVALAPSTDYDLPSRHLNLADRLRARGRRRDRREATTHYRRAAAPDSAAAATTHAHPTRQRVALGRVAASAQVRTGQRRLLVPPVVAAAGRSPQ